MLYTLFCEIAKLHKYLVKFVPYIREAKDFAVLRNTDKQYDDEQWLLFQDQIIDPCYTQRY